VGAPDRQAVRTLLDAYWTPAGWRDSPAWATDEFEHAVSAGVMFRDPLPGDHDTVVAEVVEAAAAVSGAEVVDCFLASLTSRRLDLRSALGSYAIARHVAPHRYQEGQGHIYGSCGVCGLPEAGVENDRNVLNFERFRWGGVRRLDLTYVWLDLQQFADADRPEPTDDDRRAFERLLEQLETSPAGTTAAKAAVRSWDSIRSTKEERGVVLDILGVCSVLEAPGHTGFLHGFVHAADRVEPPLRYVERSYPACWWRSDFGVNRSAAQALGLL
jgi:hypothetical protein